MKITWLGQAGLLLQGAGITVMIDPYLSDSVAALQPENHRRQPVDERFFTVPAGCAGADPRPPRPL